jgi:hypothetical protein
MKLKWLVLIGSILLSLVQIPTMAGTSVDVTINAIPSFGITGFTATYITDTQVDLSWNAAPNLLSVMVRAKYGSIPTSETDGYLVYSGVGLAASDTSMNFNENTGILYYKAFGETAPGVYGVNASDNVEGIVMLMMTLMGAALILTVSGYISKRSILAMMGALMWILAGVYSYTLSSQNWSAWDIYLGLAFGSLMFSLVGIFAPIVLREKQSQFEDNIIMTETQKFNYEMAEMNMSLHSMGNPQLPPERKSDDSDSLRKYIQNRRNEK